jgi:hypothetical protein
MSRVRDITKFLEETRKTNTSLKALRPSTTSTIDSAAVLVMKNASGMSVFSTLDSLPVTSLTTGQQAYVTENSRIYVSNGNGWYNVAVVNATPSLSLSASGTIALTAGSATTITMTATDSDNDDASLVLSLESGGDLFKFATVSQDSSVVTITPRTEDSATTLGSDGSATLTFKASDGINQATVQNTFTLSFGPDWSATPTETIVTASVAATNSNFGRTNAISADGTMLIVGAPNYDTGLSNQGAWYYFTRSGSTWTQQQFITTFTGIAAQNHFSDSLDMSSDGTYAAVGAWYNGGVGKIIVYTRSGNTWTQQAILSASDNNSSGNFGRSVKINSNGNYIVSGDTTIPSTHYGTAYIFARSGSTWSEQAKITHPGSSSNYDMFGSPGEINSDGTQALFGCQYEDDNGTNSGAVYAYSRSGSTWTYNQKLIASDAAAQSSFGYSISMDDAGDYVVISAHNQDTAGSNAGAVYVFTRSGNTWTQQQRIGMPGLATGSPNFGTFVNMNSTGTFMTVSAPFYDGNSGAVGNSGIVYLYERSGSTWSLTYTFEDSPLEASSSYGYGDNSVSSNGSYVVVPRNTVNTNTGELHIYDA